jgi:hypothetical protein
MFDRLGMEASINKASDIELRKLNLIKDCGELIDLKIVVEDKLLDERGCEKGIEKVRKLKK